MPAIIILEEHDVQAISVSDWNEMAESTRELILSDSKVYYDPNDMHPSKISEVITLIDNAMELTTSRIISTGKFQPDETSDE